MSGGAPAGSQLLLGQGPPPLTRRSRVLAVVPHFRCEDWLAVCLASLTGQTRGPDGIVVVDDASAAPPTAIVAQFPTVTLLRAAQNVGPYRLVQQVIEDTAYDAYLFQDADDWSGPDRLARLLLAAELTGAPLVGSDYLHVRGDTGTLEAVRFPVDVNAALADKPTGHALQHPTSLVARTLVAALGGYASGMRFSGDDEFLRRAAHLARVRNVPRILYFRRHRAASLTTAADTGHGSAARKAVLADMAERARRNADAVHAGAEANLAPLRRGAPVVLEHLTGPALEDAGTRGAPVTRAGAPRPDTAAVAAAVADAAAVAEPAAAALASSTPDAAAPVLVVGTDRQACALLLWCLGQHAAIEPVADTAALLGFGFAARRAAGPSTSEGCHLGTHDVSDEELRATAAAATDRLVLAEATLRPPDPTGVAAARFAAAGAAPARRWAGTLPARRDAIATALWLYPQARLIHVVGESPRTDADAGGPLRAILLAEQAVGSPRAQRVDARRLRAEPAATLAACLAQIGETYRERCTWPVRGMDPGGEVPVGGGQEGSPDDLLGLAMRGPGLADPQALNWLLTGADDELVHAAGPVEAAPQRPAPTAVAERPAVDPVPARPLSPEAAPTVALIRSAALAGQTVAVISRGDPDLLALGDITGWHFPQMPDGTYAGYHPQCSEDAIAHLEQLRAQGADLLAVPATGMWWMDHYTAFRAHLEATAQLVATCRDAGMVFDLGAAPSAQRLPAPSAQRLPATVTARSTARVTAGGRATPRRLKVQVLAWNVTHNPLGRAHLLAELLAPHHDVELVGAAFPQFGKQIWPPHQDSPVPLRTYPGGPFPAHHRRMEEIAADLDADVLVVSKPRWPSFGVGLLAKQARNRALVLDIDDRELAFVQATRGLDAEELHTYRDHAALANPYGRLWTQAGEGLVGAADAITVSNDALAAVYGGTVIPHARDEQLFDPARHDRELVRKRLGFNADNRVVLFPGTPRRHKGLVEVARALAALGDPRAKLCFIQAEEYREVKPELVGLERWLHPVAYQPFADLPALLVAADVVCVLQDPSSEVARYQMPAKVTDAFAMQVPCLVRPVPPLAGHIDAGRLEVLDGPDLAGRLRQLFDGLDACRARAQANRAWFRSAASYRAVGPVLAAIIEAAGRAPRPLSADAGDVLAFQRACYGTVPAPAPASAPAPVPAPSTPAPASAAPSPPAPVPLPPAPPRTGAGGARGDQVDVVMLWKQNDTGIYGRRHDMLLAQLVRSRRVRRVVQFDHPIGVDRLTAMERGTDHTHDALVLAQLLRRLQPPSRFKKLRQHTFVHAADGGFDTWRGQTFPQRETYVDYVAETLKRHGIGRRPTVLWVYPKNFDFPAVADAVAHDLVLADVVDDHRAWAAPGSARRELIVRNYEETLARSDVVLANCEAMRERAAALAPHVALVPNGCDLRSRLLGGRRPPELRRLRRPIVGYAGNLSSRIDVGLLDAVIGRRPEWSFVFIGSTHAGKKALRLDAHPNAHFLGPRPYEETRRFVRAFDVGIIPHLDNEMTRAMNPLKAFVYAALGTPTVATAVAGLDELGALIRIAYNVDGFEWAVAQALAESRRRREAATRKTLGDHGWDRRLAQILPLIDEALATRHPKVNP